MVPDGGGGYTLTLRDDTVFAFGDDGALRAITDRNGHTLTLSYDVDDHLETVTAASGRTLSFTWSGERIIEVSTGTVAAHGGALTWKYYYTDDLLVAACDPRDNTQTGLCTDYSYTNGLLSESRKPKGNLEARVGYYPSGEVAVA